VASTSLLTRLLVLPIRGWQLFVSPLLGRNCRFHPSCSAYAREAIERHGVVSGLCYAVRRLLRCHPWHPGGHDPVPPPPTASHRVDR
jgi:uncharacterized protein